MKIDYSTNSLPLIPSGDGKARAPLTKSGGNTAPTTTNSTSVNLGTTSSQLLSMNGSSSNTPIVNTTKVSEIRQAISEGRFQVNSSAVADSLIKSVTDLISSNQT